MKKVLVFLVLAVVLCFGCGKSVHTQSSKVVFSNNGIKIGDESDNNPIIVIFQNHTSEKATITVAGVDSDQIGWEVESRKNHALKLENMRGDISFLFSFPTLNSVSAVLNLDIGEDTRRIKILSGEINDKFSNENHRGLRNLNSQTPGKMMMEIHNSHLREFLRSRLERENKKQ